MSRHPEEVTAPERRTRAFCGLIALSALAGCGQSQGTTSVASETIPPPFAASSSAASTTSAQPAPAPTDELGGEPDELDSRKWATESAPASPSSTASLRRFSGSRTELLRELLDRVNAAGRRGRTPTAGELEELVFPDALDREELRRTLDEDGSSTLRDVAYVAPERVEELSVRGLEVSPLSHGDTVYYEGVLSGRWRYSGAGGREVCWRLDDYPLRYALVNVRDVRPSAATGREDRDLGLDGDAPLGLLGLVRADGTLAQAKDPLAPHAANQVRRC